ncbi:MAG: hypothetical protein COB24_09025 [Hyphomicrobiales bacterium]|nr:MAG: hypothetical protein COB24_09025 [Hyphomicrobiales bacterium]
MTDFSTYTDNQICAMLSAAPIDRNIRGFDPRPPNYNWVKDDGFCFRMQKQYNMFSLAPVTRTSCRWVIFSLNKNGAHFISKNTNLNRATLECFLQIHEAEQ